VVGTDRPRRPRDRPQRKPPSSAPDDAAGAALPRRRVARAEGSLGGAAVERPRATGEEPCSCSLSGLRRGRAPVGAERTGAPGRAEGDRRPRRPFGRAVREKRKPAAARGRQAPSVGLRTTPCRSPRSRTQPTRLGPLRSVLASHTRGSARPSPGGPHGADSSKRSNAIWQLGMVMPPAELSYRLLGLLGVSARTRVRGRRRDPVRIPTATTPGPHQHVIRNLYGRDGNGACGFALLAGLSAFESERGHDPRSWTPSQGDAVMESEGHAPVVAALLASSNDGEADEPIAAPKGRESRTQRFAPRWPLRRNPHRAAISGARVTRVVSLVAEPCRK
jgi:hypothetical protein